MSTNRAAWLLDAECLTGRRLPGPYETVCLGKDQGLTPFGRVCLARATDSDRLLVVQLVPAGPLFQAGQPLDLQKRCLLDLRPWSAEGWPAFAIVTPLPACLPGRYGHVHLLRLIGWGGMGEVWLAESRDFPGLQLAVKLFDNLWYNQDPLLRESCIEEARYGLEVTCEHLVRTHQLLDLREGQAAGWQPLGILMNYQQPSLKVVLEDLKASSQRLAPAVVSKWCLEVLGGVRALHERYHLVHRDLKPSNVLIRLAAGQLYTDGHSLMDSAALLGDLGTACPVGDEPVFYLYQDGWKPPELFIEGAEADQPLKGRPAEPAEDLYAFGLLVRELAGVVEGPPDWLSRVAEPLTHPDPGRRLAALPGLEYRLSPQQSSRGTPASPPAPPGLTRSLGSCDVAREFVPCDFVGRAFVKDAFEQFAQRCYEKEQGGGFLIVAGPGLGKSALVEHWAGEGPHPAFLFIKGRKHSEVSDLFKHFTEVLAKRYQVDLPGDWPSAEPEHFRQLLAYLSREQLGPDERLLLFIDALDEAEQPERVVCELPRLPLPRGVFLIATSRPSISDPDHLAPLLAEGWEKFEITAQDERNLSDLERFLGRRMSKEQAIALASATGGVFKLAMLQESRAESPSQSRVESPESRAGEEQPSGSGLSPLDSRLSAWHRQLWERTLPPTLSEDQREKAFELVRLLAAAQAPLPDDCIQRLLDWSVSCLGSLKHRLRWLLGEERETANRTDRGIRLFHPRAGDFLLPLVTGSQQVDLAETHARISKHYLGIADREGWRSLDAYGRAFLVRHLVLSRAPDLVVKAGHCLTNLDYLEATLEGPMGGTLARERLIRLGQDYEDVCRALPCHAKHPLTERLKAYQAFIQGHGPFIETSEDYRPGWLRHLAWNEPDSLVAKEARSRVEVYPCRTRGSLRRICRSRVD